MEFDAESESVIGGVLTCFLPYDDGDVHFILQFGASEVSQETEEMVFKSIWGTGDKISHYHVRVPTDLR